MLRKLQSIFCVCMLLLLSACTEKDIKSSIEVVHLNSISDSKPSIRSSNNKVATASIVGDNLVIKSVSPGNAIITVEIPEDQNYTTPEKKEIPVSVCKLLSMPSQKGSLTYTGSSQSPSWNNYNSAELTISGTTSAYNAGTYYAKFTPKTGYKWSDGTATTKSIAWKIDKAESRIYTSYSSGNCSPEYGCRITISGTYGGNLVASISGGGKISYQSGNSIDIDWDGKTPIPCTATITVYASGNSNYLKSNTLTIYRKFTFGY